jgi:hypothetical protein
MECQPSPVIIMECQPSPMIIMEEKKQSVKLEETKCKTGRNRVLTRKKQSLKQKYKAFLVC